MTLSGKLARREFVDLELPSWSTESRRKPPPMKELANVACQVSSVFHALRPMPGYRRN
ncbi:hypothetical protein K0M31_009551 [Melipona bicolor]|uniref:Uncharacterized protein n=1 Tax=Melipona bicolor TaxID=60889 RepID=A0AA40KJA6_9HYME|nr:hypothetical protein K0M31_009551 [Melipona bicolor]